MRMRIMLKMNAIGAMLRGRRHQGRHRHGAVSGADHHPGRADNARDEGQTATVGHPHAETEIQDFYVVFPNVPALPGNPGS
jgi:hypothetical protein